MIFTTHLLLSRQFQSTPLAGGATQVFIDRLPRPVFQSTPLAGGATARPLRAFAPETEFQSTPLAGGATPQMNWKRTLQRKFQSTPLAGGATEAFGALGNVGNISIHAPRGRGDVPILQDTQIYRISIHAPRGRGDYDITAYIMCGKYFNPRPSREGRLNHRCTRNIVNGISIHAPRGRGDFERPKITDHLDISIHAPRGRGDCT